MATYGCRPSAGTSAASDTYTSGNTHEDFSFELGKVDILVESNPAMVSYKYAGASGYGDSQILKLGTHSIPFPDENIVGVRIRNRNTGAATDYQITGFPGEQ